MTSTATEIATAAVQHVPEIGSTNEEALVRARRGAAAPLWIRADRQVAGRGRQGRVWASPPGNLYCSLMLRTDAPPTSLPQLSHVAAVALIEAIEETVGPMPALCLKWPNDLLLGRAKVSGILVEATRAPDGGQVGVIGCGINCTSAPSDLPYEATSLAGAISSPVDPDTLFDRLRPAMGRAFALWNEGRDYAAVRSRWLQRALPIDTLLTVRSGAAPLSGRFAGIDATGRLILFGPHGPTTVDTGDVILSETTAAARGRESGL